MNLRMPTSWLTERKSKHRYVGQQVTATGDFVVWARGRCQLPKDEMKFLDQSLGIEHVPPERSLPLPSIIFSLLFLCIYAVTSNLLQLSVRSLYIMCMCLF